MTSIQNKISSLEQTISNPQKGLPEDVFLFISRLTPLINVDLLIKDERGRTLLSWRDDKYVVRKGWHIPGGIVRYKETLKERIQKVAQSEIGKALSFDPQPIAVNQIICSQKSRGHFISLLFKCFLPGTFIPKNNELGKYDTGYLQWHTSCPSNLIPNHKKIYSLYI